MLPLAVATSIDALAVGVSFACIDVDIGNPCIVSANGAKRILELKLTEQELQKLDNSCTILNDNFKKLKL